MKRYACGVPETAQFVDCDGVRLAVSREGRGPALVCLHAVGHGGGDFAGLAAMLSDRYEVIRIDWPGQGRSDADHQPASAARYAELLAHVLRQLQIARPVIVGNSIGGAAAILYASEHPVAGLVLCDAGGLVPVWPMIKGLTRLFRGFFRAGERGASWYPRLFRWYYRFMVLPEPAAQAQRERIIAAGSECAAVLAQAWDSFGRPEADLRALAAGLPMPVWVAWSRSDRVIPLWLCRPAICRIPQAQLSSFKGGHSAFLEQPDAFLGALIAFLEALPVAEEEVMAG